MNQAARQTREDFVLSHSTLGFPPLVPEIALHLAGAVMTLWGETEALAAAHASSLNELPPPYWAFAWPGGQALARYLLDHPEIVAGKRVLDFGSGSGLVAIAAAKAGAAHIVAAEIDALARAAIALNADSNDVAINLEASDIIDGEIAWDVVLAGDMCYEQPTAKRLTSWLHKLSAAGAQVLIGDPGRTYLPAQGVRRLATYAVATSLDLEDREVRETSVYEVLPGG